MSMRAISLVRVAGCGLALHSFSQQQFRGMRLCYVGSDVTAALVCDTWEMADALNKRVHDTATAQPTVCRRLHDATCACCG
jgi:hypothetical protein